MYLEPHDLQLKRIEQTIKTPSDDVVEQLKKERLHLKDQLYVMLKKILIIN